MKVLAYLLGIVIFFVFLVGPLFEHAAGRECWDSCISCTHCLQSLTLCGCWKKPRKNVFRLPACLVYGTELPTSRCMWREIIGNLPYLLPFFNEGVLS